MKIIDIFANGKLYAFKYNGETDHELERLLNLWNDTNYLHTFIKTHNKDISNYKAPYKVFNEILDNANDIEDILIEIAEDDDRQFEEFFKPLHNQEYKVVQLSMQKGRKNYLRLYALKIDENCFVITGGAIKFTHLMKERPHTLIELNKINKCKDFLKSNNVFDNDSFYEFINQTQ
jgi:hypothetical protein